MCDFCFARRTLLRGSAALAGGAAVSSVFGRKAYADEAPLRIGYLPITDAAPLLVAHGKGFFAAEGVAVEKPILLRSWAQIIEAFIAGQVDLVHLLSPMTIWARYGSRVPGKIVAWNHVDGSALTVAPKIGSVKDLGGQTVAVPFWYSIHNVVLQTLLRAHGLRSVIHGAGAPAADEVKLVVMAPPDMPPALASGRVAGYIVAEPFNAAAETLGIGKILRLTGDVWERHACCTLFMHENALRDRPDWTQKVVTAIVKAQLYARTHRDEVAALLSREDAHRYTPQPKAVLTKVLAPSPQDLAGYVASRAIVHPGWHEQRIDFQPFPFPSYTEELVRRLRETEMDTDKTFLRTLDPAFAASDLVDDRFVRRALAEVGGAAAFDLPAGLVRTETIAP
jgi:NitT/TauT family transport system substrate-binding protein